MYSSKINRLKKKEFRDAFINSHLVHGLAHQIRTLRIQRGWSQSELAEKLGVKGQSAVARMEDPSYGKLSITTLVKLTSAFDVALSVKFQSYGNFLLEHENLSPESLKVESFETDHLINALESDSHYIERYSVLRQINIELQSPQQVAVDLVNGCHKDLYLSVRLPASDGEISRNFAYYSYSAVQPTLPKTNFTINALELKDTICQKTIPETKTPFQKLIPQLYMPTE
jgi:transcriptional regulator with XRE-family HTH domain